LPKDSRKAKQTTKHQNINISQPPSRIFQISQTHNKTNTQKAPHNQLHNVQPNKTQQTLNKTPTCAEIGAGAVQFECAVGVAQLVRRAVSSYTSSAIMREMSIAIDRIGPQMRSAAKRYATSHINVSARARGNGNDNNGRSSRKFLNILKMLMIIRSERRNGYSTRRRQSDVSLGAITNRQRSVSSSTYRLNCTTDLPAQLLPPIVQ